MRCEYGAGIGRCAYSVEARLIMQRFADHFLEHTIEGTYCELHAQYLIENGAILLELL